MSIWGKVTAIFLAIAVATGSGVALSAPASAASIKVSAGAKCSVAKKQVKMAKISLVCKKNAKGKLVWTKAAAVAPKPLAPAKAAPLTIVEEPQPVAAASETPQSPSGYPVVIDPNAGGSAEVVVRTPEEAETPEQSAAVAPANLRVTQLTDKSVTVTHDLVAGISQYQVYLRYGDSFTAKGTDSSNPIVEFADLTADWDYVVCVYYRVNNVDSNKLCINVHTLGQRAIEPVKPNGPATISLSSTETTITATWSAVAGATKYSLCHVRLSSWQCGGFTMLSETSAIFQDGSISAGWRYGIQVTAIFADGTRSLASMNYVMSAGSQPPPPTKYDAPTNLRIVDLTPTSVTVAWDAPVDSPVTFWTVVTRYKTSYSSTGVDGSSRTFTSTAIWPGGGFEIILSGFDMAGGKWTAETRIGFFAPAAN